MHTHFKSQLPIILSAVGAVIGAFVGGIYLSRLLHVTKDLILGAACCYAGVALVALVGGLIGRRCSRRG